MWCSHFKTLHQCRSFMTALQNFFFTATSLIFNLFLMTNNIISTSDRQPCYYFVKKNCRISRHEFLAYFLSRVYITNTYTYISIYICYIYLYYHYSKVCLSGRTFSRSAKLDGNCMTLNIYSKKNLRDSLNVF